MCVPLRDQSGRVRYYLGAQLDITDLVNESTGLESLKRLVHRHDKHSNLVKSSDAPVETIHKDEFEQLSETFNPQELEKLIKLRQREHAESEEKVAHNASAERQEKRASSSAPRADIDDAFQLNGEGSAPPLGYYKTVRAPISLPMYFQTNWCSISLFDLLHLFESCSLPLIYECLESFSRL